METNKDRDRIKRHCQFLLCVLFLVCQSANAGKRETKYVNVGDEFTVYTSYHYYTQGVTWTWDSGVLELVGQLYGTSTSATFRAKKASPSSGVIIQTVTYYMQSGTTSSGINRDVDSWTIHVTDNTTVTLSRSRHTLSPGESFLLTAYPSISQYSGSYKWTSSNSNVAYVTSTGQSVTVRANKSGNTTITVKLDNGKYAECYVTVRNVEIKSAGISPSTLSVDIDESKSLTLDISPSNGTIVSKKWMSSDPYIATVSSSGVVTGNSVGKTDVYCIINETIESEHCSVSVSKPSFSLNTSSPEDNATGQSVFVLPTATFCRSIYKGSEYDGITFKNKKGVTVDGSCSISGSNLVFTPEKPLEPNTTYIFTIPGNAVKDKYDTYNSKYSISFTTGNLEKLTLRTSVTDKFLSEGDKITLQANKTAVGIYYTIDGSTPTRNSILYTDGIIFKNDIKLRAIAIGEGYESSDILSMDYYLTNVSVTGRYPDTDTKLYIYRDVNPSLTFSNRIEPSENINKVAVIKNGKDSIDGEVIVADSSIYFVPDKPLELGCCYKVSVPQNAILTWLGEENDATSWTFNTGDFATAIAMGNEISAAIKTDGSLMTWGEIYKSGNSADGSYQNEMKTIPEAFVANDVAFVSTGYTHNAIIKTDGSLWMWGRQYCGEFGNNSTTGDAAPVMIMNDVAEVSCGGQSSAIVKNDGSLWMVGRNDFGQIGDSTILVRKSPVKIMENVKSAVAGWCSSYAIQTNGDLMAWGRNDKGQLGDGTTDDRWEPTKIMDNVAIVSASHTETNIAAAIKSDGSLWIWGNGNSTPRKILDEASSVSIGTGFVIAIKSNGTMWKISDGSTEMLNESISGIKVNETSILALMENGSVWSGNSTKLTNKEIDGRSSSQLEGLYLNRRTIRIAKGTRSVLVAKPTAINADYSTLVWKSSNESIADVSNRGVITANALGETDITVTIADSNGRNHSAICHVIAVESGDIDEIEDIFAEQQSIRVWANDNILYITGLISGQRINVYDTNGALVDSFIAESTEEQRPIYKQGVYIVRSSNGIFKVLNK